MNIFDLWCICCWYRLGCLRNAAGGAYAENWKYTWFRTTTITLVASRRDDRQAWRRLAARPRMGPSTSS
eukprot:2433621-Heterocapsa_arctica.AAC.1